MSDVLKFAKNKPEVVALQFAMGKMVPSQYGASEVLFTLVDGRRMYLAQPVADKIREAGIAAREEFQICKVGSGKADFDIQLLQGQRRIDEGAAATSWQSSTAPSHAAPSNAHQAVQRPHQSTAPDTESNCMMACFKSAIDAIAEAQSYAKRSDLGITFTSEDVRAVALTCYINKCKGGR